MRGRFEDITGQKFGRLTVQGIKERRNKRIYWLCHCDCGGETVTRVDNLKTGHTTSCGCYHEQVLRQPTKHGMWNSKTYKSYYAMLQRCQNPEHENYDLYKDRVVCDRWTECNGFENFLEDMGERPEGTTLDRIDNTKGYSRDNCRWTDPKTQMQNASISKWWFISGVRFACAREASESLGVPKSTIVNWCDGPYGSREDCWSELKYT